MAQTGYTPIKLYASTTAAAVPLAANLDNTNGAELAINITDGKLYYKDNTGTVKVLAGSGGAGIVAGSNTQIQYNNSGAFGASANLTFDGTTLGSTGLNITGNTTLGDASTDTVTVNGYMGVGGAGTSAYGLQVVSTALTGTGQVGVFSSPTITSAATTSGYGYYAKVSTAAASFTVSDIFGLRVIDATKGAGSTITNQHGVYINDQTQGINNYGVTSVVSSGANKWNIYASGTAANYFAGTALLGTTTSQTVSNGNVTGNLQIETANGAANATMVRNTANVNGPIFVLGKSRGAALGSRTAVVSGDTLGNISFDGADGTSMLDAASIVAAADGTPTTGSVPGRLIFGTTAAGNASPTERMRIDSAGNINIATAGARITGDFSNATLANRVMFQTSTTNGNTGLGVITNGTGNSTGIRFFNSSDITNSGALFVGASATETFFQSVITGTGTYVPMNFYTGGSERMRIDTSGNVGIGTSSPAVKLAVSSTDAILLPKGTTAQQPAGVSGYLRFNTDTSQFEGYNGTAWSSVGGATLSNDTSTASNLYPIFANATSGSATTVYTSNAKLLYKPSTGELQASEVVSTNGLTVMGTTMSASYTLATGNNALTVGPFTVASGAVFTISSGQRHVVI